MVSIIANGWKILAATLNSIITYSSLVSLKKHLKITNKFMKVYVVKLHYKPHWSISAMFLCLITNPSDWYFSYVSLSDYKPEWIDLFQLCFSVWLQTPVIYFSYVSLSDYKPQWIDLFQLCFSVWLQTPVNWSISAMFLCLITNPIDLFQLCFSVWLQTPVNWSISAMFLCLITRRLVQGEGTEICTRGCSWTVPETKHSLIKTMSTDTTYTTR